MLLIYMLVNEYMDRNSRLTPVSKRLSKANRSFQDGRRRVVLYLIQIGRNYLIVLMTLKIEINLFEKIRIMQIDFTTLSASMISFVNLSLNINEFYKYYLEPSITYTSTIYLIHKYQ